MLATNHFLFLPLSRLRSRLQSESQMTDFFPGLVPVGGVVVVEEDASGALLAVSVVGLPLG